MVRALAGSAALALVFCVLPGASPANAATVAWADREFVVQVRGATQAAMAASALTSRSSANPRIQEIGRRILAQDRGLDRLVRETAARLDVPLPDTLDAGEQVWLDQLAASNGATFDATYVGRLRALDGMLLPAAATARARSRNDAVRRLAHETNEVVLAQLNLLEGSGLVDFGALPPQAASPVPAGPVVDPLLLARARAGDSFLGVSRPLVWAVLVAALATITVVCRRLFAGRVRRIRVRPVRGDATAGGRRSAGPRSDVRGRFRRTP